MTLPVLLWCLDGTRGPWGAFGLGWAAGAAQFAAALFWIVEPFLVEPEVFGWMAPFALVGMAGGLALFWAVPFALARAWWPPGPGRVLLLAALWTLADYARGHVLTGFPWGLFGYAWVETPVIQAVALDRAARPRVPDAGGRDSCPGSAPGGRFAPAAALVAAGWGFGGLAAGAAGCRSGPSRWSCGWCSRTRDQALKWQPGMEQVFYDRHIALSRARKPNRRPT